MTDTTHQPAKSILVVDDDDDLRKMLVAFLGDCGYQVTEATSGEDALPKFRATGPRLVVTDFSMPGMNGAELVKHLKRLDPDVKVLILTGDLSIAEEAVARHGSVPEAIMQKPVELAALLRLAAESAG